MKIKINNKFYNFFDDVAVNLTLDSIASTFSFKARFNPNNSNHRLIFKPLTYPKVQIFDDNDTLMFTGVIVNTKLPSSNTPSLASVSGYSLPGVLEDSTIPYTAYPLEKINVNLKDIVDRLLINFNLKYVIDNSVSSDANIQYKKTVADVSETVKSYLAKLCAQRNIVLSHNEKGELLFFRPNINAKPKLFLNKENTLSMELNVNGQGIHSEISVIRQPSKENNNLSPVDSLTNIMVWKYKPLVKILSSGSDTETKKATDNVLSSELKNISFTATLNRFENIKVGDIIDVQNDEIYLFERTKLMVSSISLKENVKGRTTVLNLSMPQTYSGELTKNIFI